MHLFSFIFFKDIDAVKKRMDRLGLEIVLHPNDITVITIVGFHMRCIDIHPHIKSYSNCRASALKDLLLVQAMRQLDGGAFCFYHVRSLMKQFNREYNIFACTP